MILTEPLEMTQRITTVFERLHVPYFIGGSLASSLHGIPRATHDVDLVADIRLQHVSLLVNALEMEFYIDAQMIHDAIRHQTSFNVLHLATMFKIDIFVLQSNPDSQAEMARRESYQVSDDPEQRLFLASAEDTILHKLLWFQMGGAVSERQWHDILGVLQVQHDTLDYAYLENGAQRRGVAGLLQQARQQADTRLTEA